MDKNVRFIIQEANVQDHLFLFVNLCAPTESNEQSTFSVEEVREEMDNYCLAEDCNIIIGGDLNVIFYPDLDGNGAETQNEKNLSNTLITLTLLMI